MKNDGLFSTRFVRTCPPDCGLRHPGCQDHCEGFKEAKKENEKRKETIRKAKEYEHLLNTKPKRDRKR